MFCFVLFFNTLESKLAPRLAFPNKRGQVKTCRFVSKSCLAHVFVTSKPFCTCSHIWDTGIRHLLDAHYKCLQSNWSNKLGQWLLALYKISWASGYLRIGPSLVQVVAGHLLCSKALAKLQICKFLTLHIAVKFCKILSFLSCGQGVINVLPYSEVDAH